MESVLKKFNSLNYTWIAYSKIFGKVKIDIRW